MTEGRGEEIAKGLAAEAPSVRRFFGPIAVILLFFGTFPFSVCLFQHGTEWWHGQKNHTAFQRWTDYSWFGGWALSLVLAQLHRPRTVEWRRFGRLVISLFVLRFFGFPFVHVLPVLFVPVLYSVLLISLIVGGRATFAEPWEEKRLEVGLLRHAVAWLVLLTVVLGIGRVLFFDDPSLERKRRSVVIYRLERAASAARVFRYQSGRWPQSFEELTTAVPGQIYVDFWREHGFTWQFDPTGVPVFGHLGEDRQVGGRGRAKDLSLRADEPIAKYTRLRRWELDRYLAMKPLRTMSGSALAALLEEDFWWALDGELERELAASRLRLNPAVAEALEILSKSAGSAPPRR